MGKIHEFHLSALQNKFRLVTQTRHASYEFLRLLILILVINVPLQVFGLVLDGISGVSNASLDGITKSGTKQESSVFSSFILSRYLVVTLLLLPFLTE